MISMELSNGIEFNYRDIILFRLKVLNNNQYVMMQISGGDNSNILELDVNNNLIIDGVDEI